MASKTQTSRPHGGELINCMVPGNMRAEEMEKARRLPKIMIDLEAVITIEMIGTGVLSPNSGFMNEEDYKSVLEHGRLANGIAWPVPLSFAPTGTTNEQVIRTLSIGDEVALVDEESEPVAVLTVADKFRYDREFRAKKLFGSTSRSHPGIDAIYRRMGEVALGGPLRVLRRVNWGPFEKLRMEPKDTRKLFAEKKFKTVGGFITGANPLHRGHEYIHRNALEELDGIFVQPLVEMAKREYTRHEFRVLAYRSVLNTYYPADRAILAPLRVTYIFAGPRETVLHALIMKNYGCTHALIGRDHAGIGTFYDKYASHHIFDEFTPEELGIDVRLFFEVFYCTRCSCLATRQSCPHDERYRINISGTGIREMLRQGIMPPKEIIRPESARIAIQGIQPKGTDSDNETISPAGKTIAGVFPFYCSHSGLGGKPRKSPLNPEELTTEDLLRAAGDVRAHADRIYGDIFNEFSYNTDLNRSLQPEWINEARKTMKEQQEMVIENLEEKVNQAPETASDEFMYQDRKEAETELKTAEKILTDLPDAVEEENTRYRIWNSMDYDKYRS